MRARAAAPLLAVTLLAARLAGQANAPAPDYQRGGWLLLEGGGRLRGTEIVTRFDALAGGPDRNYVAITSAG